MKALAKRSVEFSPHCAACPRLARLLAAVRTTYPHYHARPVPPFGDAHPRLLVVGLAPGMHGANRTGRPFTGDHAGIMLYETLHRFGLASHPHAVRADDGLTLIGCRVTNAVKCLPPQNKPEMTEVRRCNGYLSAELQALPPGAAILALGVVAHRAVLMALALPPNTHVFGHGAVHQLPAGRRLFDSYHCSRYNTQTRRLTQSMFDDVLSAISHYLVGR